MHQSKIKHKIFFENQNAAKFRIHDTEFLQAKLN